ncbi:MULTISPECIES: methyltransferase domain-containing protein [unclassified Stenotrophomonas]|uniref:methyltransferase domain-containing protein n=1 Tax=unclassified Stenotrophomonas TaxID=196198 RepID=UPI0021181FCB|nr:MULTISPECIES: methyltransferase domain-containing protein [unclassified Stenotrophomonas]
MPAPPSPRQASVASWFDTEPAQVLCQLELQHLMPLLAEHPVTPWLWVAPTAAWAALPSLPGRGLRLYRDGAGFAGDAHCGLPLPLPSESVNAIVLQHVTARDAEQLIDECARVLMPGGRLWLSTLNPFSPYRRQWRHHGLVVRSPQRLRHTLERCGLACQDVTYLGPMWHDRAPGHRSLALLRAACLFSAEKRTLALPGPTPLPVRQWHGTVAT